MSAIISCKRSQSQLSAVTLKTAHRRQSALSMDQVSSPTLKLHVSYLPSLLLVISDPIALNLSMAANIHLDICTYDFRFNAICWKKESLLLSLVAHDGQI